MSATDGDNDSLLYTLRGTDASSFSLLRTSGQLKTKAALDYETKTSYSVTITVYDYNIGGDTISVTINVTDVDESNNSPTVQMYPASPNTTLLLSNYPNPFNPETWIPYQLSKPSDVHITIYDIRGTVVRKLQLGYQKAGYYLRQSSAAHWDGRNMLDECLASGVYFYSLDTDDFTATRRMLIVK